MAGESSFANVKVVRKATLKKDVSPKSKFMYKGVKIARSAASQHSLYEEDSSGTRSDGDDSVSFLPGVANPRLASRMRLFAKLRSAFALILKSVSFTSLEFIKYLRVIFFCIHIKILQ